MSYFYNKQEHEPEFARIILTVVVSLLFMVGLSMWGCPRYHVWQQGLLGEAELKRAQQNRQIAVNEAQAKKDSAKLLGEAEVARAHGVAEANKIIGDSLKGHEAYLRYLWINNVDKVTGQIIYIPTEANLPILEATRNQPKEPK